MRVGIFSDTHTKVELAQKTLTHLVANGAQAFVHAGDVVDVEVLTLLKNLGLPYVCVFGNNDRHLYAQAEHHPIYPEPHTFSLGGLRWKLMHHPFFLTPDCDVVVFGHTHIQEWNQSGKTLFLNPGEVCAREKPLCECMLLEITGEALHLTSFEMDTKSHIWRMPKKTTFKVNDE